ncbi:MAG: [FeFe] hydrogenase H-cluster radical SAM maturase HydG [bacterium]
MTNEIINQEKFNEILQKTKNPTPELIKDILDKANEKQGLNLEEIGFLVNADSPQLMAEIYETAGRIKDEIYGERLVFFAPLYVSNFCINDCAYCNYHLSNRELTRHRLTLEEVQEQTELLLKMGHKRVLLELGEDPINNPIDYVVEVIEKIYSVRLPVGNIRRINVNIGATTVENYKKLKQAGIGTYQLFQETYHQETYQRLHRGPKADYIRQLTAHERAFEAGIDDLGLGVLFGLYDWRFEVLALVSHAQYFEQRYGVGPHTFSVPRFREGSTISYHPDRYKVSDADFLKIIAILRLAVPYTGMIISTRETPKIRKIAYRIGISQTSAGSVTTVGGYGRDNGNGQFTVYDQRSLKEVISTVLQDRLLPSFCTACYRRGRTGDVFMGLAKPGEIHNFCRPNGLLTFAEYLEDFANKSNGLYQKGYEVVNFYLNKMEDENLRHQTEKYLKRIKEGKRDLYF